MAFSNLLTQLLLGVVVVPLVVLAFVSGFDRAFAGLPRTSRAHAVRPWVWLTPIVLLSGAVLVYPVVDTVRLSLAGKEGHGFVGLQNFAWALSGELLDVLRNNLVWLVVLPVVTVCLGLLVAVLADRVGYERLVRTVVLLPAGISFVAAGVTWRLVYGYHSVGRPQTGVANGIWTRLGFDPVAWLADPRTATPAMVFVAVWMTLGTSALVLSAGVKGVPAELTEAARLDGAGEFRVFTTVYLPALWPTLLVVTTTQVVFALKIFDIVYVLTNGSYGTDVVANRIYHELFLVGDIGHASALAVVLLVVASPIVVLNVRQFRQEANAR